MDYKAASELLNFYVRPQTFPLAIKMCERDGELPPKTRLPKKDMGLRMPLCQAMGISRRYGWTLALGKEDQSCPFGSLAMGFLPARPGFVDGSFLDEINPGTKEIQAANAQALRRFEYGRYRRVLIAPLARAGFAPDVIVIYGNSAQVMRLVQGALYHQGGALTSNASGRADCADLIVQPMQTGECHFVLPCNGDRIFGGTQDHEVAFTLPASKLQTVLDGLVESHESGLQRYPIPSFLRFEATLPPDYYRLTEYLEKGE